MLISTLTTRCLIIGNPNLVPCETLLLRKDKVKSDFTVLQVGDLVQFYEPHRTAGDPHAFHTAEIISIVDGDNPLVLSSTFMLSRHNKVKKVVPGVDDDEDSDKPLSLKPHWRNIDKYTLIRGGNHRHATAYERAAENGKTNARRLKKEIIRKVAKSNGLCLRDAFSHNK